MPDGMNGPFPLLAFRRERAIAMVCRVAQAKRASPAPTSGPGTGPGSQRQTILLAAFLALTTFAIFLPATRCGFLGCDDPTYVIDNSVVLEGLTGKGFVWALTTPHAGLWHPLTWWSHMLDVQWAGLRPWGHHLTSILFHAFNAALCFLAFRSLTGAVWRSFLLAALWAWHPLRVESVAWIAERKDVLSGFFFLAALWSYAGYAKILRWRRLGLTFLLFALGLMSKGIVLTLPAVLLLLDVWPLQRARWPWLGTQGWGRLLLEKIPFATLSALSAALTVWAAKQSGAVITTAAVPLDARISNALVSYLRYLGKWILPRDLAVFYPFPEKPELALAGAALLLLAAISIVAFLRASKQGYLMTGWFWYLGVLVPVIGFVQAGAQAMADRFMYLPSLGLGVMVLWGLYDWVRSRGWTPALLPVPAAIAAILYSAGTLPQFKYWTDSITLFTQASTVTPANFFTEVSLGEAFLQAKRYPEATQHLQRALELDPKNFTAAANLGNVYFSLEQFSDALKYYQAGRQLQPDHPGLNWMLGRTYARLQQPGPAEEALRRSIRAAPDQAQARMDLAQVLAGQGRQPEAAQELSQLIQEQPGAIEPRLQLALLLDASGRAAEAVTQYRELLRLNPDSPLVLNNLAWAFATHPDAGVRNGAEAVRLAERACALVQEREAPFLGTLAAAYAEAGRFEDAVRTASRAIAVAQKNGQSAVVAINQQLLDLYKASKAYRNSNATNAPIAQKPNRG